MKTTRTFLVSMFLAGCVGEVVEVKDLTPPEESTRAPAVLTLTASASPDSRCGRISAATIATLAGSFTPTSKNM